MKRKGDSEIQKVPKQILQQKVKLINPNLSPTASPLRRVQKFVNDRYVINVPEDFTIYRSDLPQFSSLHTKDTISSIRPNEASLFNNPLYFSTEASDYQTPIVEFMPCRPKRFCP